MFEFFVRAARAFGWCGLLLVAGPLGHVALFLPSRAVSATPTLISLRPLGFSVLNSFFCVFSFFFFLGCFFLPCFTSRACG